MTLSLSHELEGLSFSPLWTGKEVAKRLKGISFWIFFWGPGGCRTAGAREWHKEAGEAEAWRGGLSILVME